VSSLEDMRRFILEHSDFSRAQTNVTKHVNIVTQLSEAVAARSLMDVSTVRRQLGLLWQAMTAQGCSDAWGGAPGAGGAKCVVVWWVPAASWTYPR
jgi:hypothetical protein